MTSEPLPAYADQIEPLRKTFAEQAGQQPGDPAKAAAAIVRALAAEAASAAPGARQRCRGDGGGLAGRKQQAELTEWETVTRSTDFD